MDYRKDALRSGDPLTKMKAELNSESKLHRVGQKQGMNYQIICHTEPNFD